LGRFKGGIIMSTNTLKQALEIVYGDIKNINKRVKNLERILFL
jgi:hypothetical protein